MADASGYLLLTVPDCRIDSGGHTHRGVLGLECISIAPDAANHTGERDIWLVLRLGAFEMAIPPVQPIAHDRAAGIWTIPGSPIATVHLPTAASGTPLREDLDTFEVLLAQYGVVHEQGGASPAGIGEKGDNGLKGRLVLVDESDGEIVGELSDHFAVREDSNLNAQGREKDPVVIEMPDVEFYGQHGQGGGQQQEITVHAIRPEERDSLMRGARVLSRGIILATDAISAGLSMASNKFVSSTKPNETPVVFSERTRKNVKRVHKVSGTAVEVTAKTTNMIFSAVDQVAHYVAGGHSRAPSRSITPTPVAVPVPSQSGSGTPVMPGHYAPTPGPVPPPPYSKSATMLPVGTPPAIPPRKSATGASTPYVNTLLSPTPMSPGQQQSQYFSPTAMSPVNGPPPSPGKKPRLLNRILMATDLIVTTLEESGKQLITAGTSSLSASAGHRYGQDVGSAIQMGGETMRNVGIVYIDARGVGRRALLKRAGKGMWKARIGGNKEVYFGADQPPPLPHRG